MKLFVASSLLATTAVILTSSTQAEFPSTVADLLDTTADPCDDFYQYTCGAWVKNTIIPNDETSVDYSFSTIEKRNELVIPEILKEDWPLIGEFWDSCLDTDTINDLGATPLQPALKRITAASTTEELFELAGELSASGLNFFTAYGATADSNNATQNVLYFSTASLTLPDQSYYLDNSTFAEYEPELRTYISTILELAGVTSEDQAYGSSSIADTVIAIELQLADLLAGVAASEEEMQMIPFGELASTYPYSIGQIASGLGLLQHAKLTQDSEVAFYATRDYFNGIEEIAAASSVAELQIYLSYVYVSHYSKMLSEPFLQANFNLFGKALSGLQERSTRVEVCTARETTYFPDLIGKYYFMKMFDTQRQNSTVLMVKLIEEAMAQHIAKLTWLDDATRAQAKAKLDKVTNLIGHSLQKKSYPFVLYRDTYFENILTLERETFNTTLKKINNPVDHTEWGMSAAEVNAYYDPSQNQIVFPAAILQPPMFNGSSHPAQNFGSIGAVVGHELTHGFDSNGRNYDGDGNKKNWWTQETSDEFDVRAECLAEEYDAFVVIGENGTPIGHVHGNDTITENIADNGGLSLAFDAYHNYLNSGEAVIPPSGTDISADEADKLFFIAFGQTFCGKARDGAMKQQLETDPHSPGRWRINGATMNNDNFAKVFQCPAGSKMNPTKKCQLW